AGISPDTGNPVCTTPEDAPLTYTFNEAAAYAKQLNVAKHLGHDDWHVPTKNELNVLFNNRAAIGALSATGSYPGGCYWSSSDCGDHLGAIQRLTDGHQSIADMNCELSLRCVRG